LFQGEGNLAIYNNVFVNRHGPALRIQPHNDVPKAVDVVRNTVLARDTGIAIRIHEDQPAYPQRVAQNLVFASRPLVGGEQRANLTGGLDAAARYLRKPYAMDLSIDLTPRFNLLAEARSGPNLPEYPDLERDLAGTLQPAARLGALGAGLQQSASLGAIVHASD
jgi:hypothetical protein